VCCKLKAKQSVAPLFVLASCSRKIKRSLGDNFVEAHFQLPITWNEFSFSHEQLKAITAEKIDCRLCVVSCGDLVCVMPEKLRGSGFGEQEDFADAKVDLNAALIHWTTRMTRKALKQRRLNIKMSFSMESKIANWMGMHCKSLCRESCSLSVFWLLSLTFSGEGFQSFAFLDQVN
jgi:hypothetical protein